MPIKNYGDKADRLIAQPEGFELNRDEFGRWTAIVPYKCATNSLLKLIPAENAKLQGFENLFLRKVNTRKLRGGYTQLTLIYEGSVSSSGGSNIPPPPREELLISENSIPIELHPKFFQIPNSMKQFDSDGNFVRFKSSSAYTGIENYLEGGAIWQVTDFSLVKPSEANVAAVSTISTPIGLADATPGKWRYMGAPCSKEGPWWARRRSWQYSKTGWSNYFYT